MGRAIGVLTTEHIAAALVEDNKVSGPLYFFPEKLDDPEALLGMPAEAIAESMQRLIEQAARGEPAETIGIGFPGFVRGGVIEDAPNLHQAKGFNLRAALASSLAQKGLAPAVAVFNEADVIAAGIAAARGGLDKVTRLWFLGHGVGFGRYPMSEGVWEGGHCVVTLDPKENFCGCGGVGHLEGIVGHRAMRLRFMDMEPEEIFAHARSGDDRCTAFVRLWHRALAAATATSIHLDGPGRFFISGPNARFVDLGLVNLYLGEMVKMSPLLGSILEVVSTSDEVGIIGAAINAARAESGM
jgi:glucokinase